MNQVYLSNIANHKRRALVSKERSLMFWLSITLPLWLIAYFTELPEVADAAALFGTLVSLGWLWSRFGKPLEMIRISRLGAASLCAIQNSSWLTASLVHKSLGKSITQSLLEIDLQLSYYFLAIIYTILFAIMLAWIGSSPTVLNLEKKVYVMLKGISNIPINKLQLIIIGIVVLELGLIASGVIGQKSIIVEGGSDQHRPAWFFLYDAMLPSQLMANALLAVKNSGQKSSFYKKFTWGIVGLSILLITFIFFTKGRLGLVFSIIVHGYWMVFFSGKKPKIIKIIIIAAVIYPVLSQALLFNNFIRSANSGLANAKGSVIDVIPQAWEKFQSSSNLREEEGARTEKNLATRPLVASTLALCLQFPEQKKQFSYGENLVNSAVWVIPGPLFPDKANYLIAEELLYKYFPIGDGDAADSAYLSSYTEFSWAGILIFPLLIVGLWILVLKFMSIITMPAALYVVTFSMFLQVFMLKIGEGALTEWFLVLRSFLTIYFGFAVVKILTPNKKAKFRAIKPRHSNAFELDDSIQ